MIWTLLPLLGLGLVLSGVLIHRAYVMRHDTDRRPIEDDGWSEFIREELNHR